MTSTAERSVVVAMFGERSRIERAIASDEGLAATLEQTVY